MAVHADLSLNLNAAKDECLFKSPLNCYIGGACVCIRKEKTIKILLPLAPSRWTSASLPKDEKQKKD